MAVAGCSNAAQTEPGLQAGWYFSVSAHAAQSLLWTSHALRRMPLRRTRLLLGQMGLELIQSAAKPLS